MEPTPLALLAHWGACMLFEVKAPEGYTYNQIAVSDKTGQAYVNNGSVISDELLYVVQVWDGKKLQNVLTFRGACGNIGREGIPFPEPTEGATPTQQPTPTVGKETPQPTATGTPPRETPRPSETQPQPSHTPRPTGTTTERPTSTHTPRPTATETPLPTLTNTPRPPTPTPTPSQWPTPVPTNTDIPDTGTPGPSPTPRATPTQIP